MNDQEATQEVAWVAREARRISHTDVPRSEVVEYFRRKAALLEHIAGTFAGQERIDAYAMAAKARDEAEHLAAGLEWPRYGQTISAEVL